MSSDNDQKFKEKPKLIQESLIKDSKKYSTTGKKLSKNENFNISGDINNNNISNLNLIKSVLKIKDINNDKNLYININQLKINFPSLKEGEFNLIEQEKNQ